MLKDIIAELPRLTKKELSVVQAALARLSGKSDEEVPQLYTAMVTALGSQIPYIRFQDTVAFKTWKLNLPLTMKFVDETWPDIQDVVKLGLLRYLLELLVEDLRRLGVTVTLGVLVNNLPRLPATFDRCFPGYRESGLSHLIVKLMVRA